MEEKREEEIDVNVTMTLRIKKSAFDELRVIEHHAEYLLDLDNWPSIKSVYDVSVTKESIDCNTSDDSNVQK